VLAARGSGFQPWILADRDLDLDRRSRRFGQAEDPAADLSVLVVRQSAVRVAVRERVEFSAVLGRRGLRLDDRLSSKRERALGAELGVAVQLGGEFECGSITVRE
jgi:hypothetical protein